MQKLWNSCARYAGIGTALCFTICSHTTYASNCSIPLSVNAPESTQQLYAIDNPSPGVTLSRISHLSTLAPQLDSLNLAANVCNNGGTWFRNCPQEPWITINPKNPQNMICGMIQDRLTWDEALGIAVYYTFDGGTTWSESAITGTMSQNPTLQGALNNFQCDADPNIRFDANGTAYILRIPFNAAATAGQPNTYYPEALTLAKSYDGGQTWTKPTYIVQDGGTNFLDRQTLWPDPTRPNVVYTLWTDDLGIAGTAPKQCQLKFARSRDNGNTWDLFNDQPYQILYAVDQSGYTNPPPPPGSGDNNTFFLWGGELNVLNDATLVVTICNQQFYQGPNFALNIPSQFIEVRSTDGGNTWTQVGQNGVVRNYAQAYTVAPNGLNVANYENGINTAYDPIANTTYPKGILYAVTIDTQFATPTGYAGATITMSTDGGLTWSNPQVISPCGLNTNGQQPYQPSWPAVAVNSAGQVGVLYGDFRNPDNVPSSVMQMPTDYWLTVWDRGLKNPREIRITPESFDTTLASIRPEDTYGVADAYMLGDYMRVVPSGNQFVAVIAVTNPGVPQANSKPKNNGAPLNIDAARRQDILFAKINPTYASATCKAPGWKPKKTTKVNKQR